MEYIDSFFSDFNILDLPRYLSCPFSQIFSQFSPLKDHSFIGIFQSFMIYLD